MNPSDQARQVGVVDSWLGEYKAQSAVADPQTATVYGDTGEMAGGWYDVLTTISLVDISGVGQIMIQWRNAANNATLFDLSIFPQTGNAYVFSLPWSGIKISSSERVRVYVNTGFSGFLGVAILAVRRA